MTQYILKVPTAIFGDVIPLGAVAEAMARTAATGHGAYPYHKQTFKAQLPLRAEFLIHEAHEGRLNLCDAKGLTNKVNIGEAEKQTNGTGIYSLYAKLKHLNEWGDTNGDSFAIEDMPVEVTTLDLKDENGNVKQKGHYRALVAISDDTTINPDTPRRGITKRKVMSAFQDITFDYDHWGKNLASPPDWLLECRVAKGNKVSKGSRRAPSTWNPVLIAIALSDKKILIKTLDAVFINLKDWADEWAVKSDYLR